MPVSQAEERAQAYTEAWCSHVPEAVASFYAEDGRITINSGEPSNGREQVTEMARGFIGAFPDIICIWTIFGRQEPMPYIAGRWRVTVRVPEVMVVTSRSADGNIGAMPKMVL